MANKTPDATPKQGLVRSLFNFIFKPFQGSGPGAVTSSPKGSKSQSESVELDSPEPTPVDSGTTTPVELTAPTPKKRILSTSETPMAIACNVIPPESPVPLVNSRIDKPSSIPTNSPSVNKKRRKRKRGVDQAGTSPTKAIPSESSSDKPREQAMPKSRYTKNAKRRWMTPQDIYPGTLTEVPHRLIKYWHQRYNLFSQYDNGIRMDEQGWYSVTPEAIAHDIAKRCKGKTVIDAFCGVGGNAIQFAQVCTRVIAIDIDPQRLECAKHNAEVYGVADKIEFILGDFFDLAPRLAADVVFLSPPWGGPEYNQEPVYNLQEMMPLDGKALFELSHRITPEVIYFLPRNTDPVEIKRLAPDENVEVQQNCLFGALKSVTVYFGKLAQPPPVPESTLEEET
ncbi:putative diacylglycerol O-acyltransferase tgs1 [Dispira simplex]|nr:putative diacylglycerol O-acyltransferase tgs1 [Dispira simplex]